MGTQTIEKYKQFKKNAQNFFQARARDRIWYCLEYRLLKTVQEPTSRYWIDLKVGYQYITITEVMQKFERLGFIKKVDYNPNKYLITHEGRRVLYLIIQFNKLANNYTQIEEDFEQEY